jgi:hypothetical protein
MAGSKLELPSAALCWATLVRPLLTVVVVSKFRRMAAHWNAVDLTLTAKNS